MDAVELDGVADAPKAEPDAKGRKPAQSMTKPTIRSLAQRIASRAAAGGEGGGAAAAAAELFHLLREARCDVMCSYIRVWAIGPLSWAMGHSAGFVPTQ